MSTLNNIQLNESVGVFEIKTPEEFADFLKFEKAILYLQVDWSGYEHMSRGLIYDLLIEMNQNAVSNKSIPVFKLDCTGETSINIRNWFDSSRYIRKRIYSFGYGELLLVRNGVIITCIEYPADRGKEQVKSIWNSWNRL